VKRLLLFLPVLVLAGCVTPPALTGAALQARWQERQEILDRIDRWDLHGRIAVRAGDRGWQAALRWVRDGSSQHLSLHGPVGSSSVVVEQDASGARLRDSRGHDVRDSDTGRLLQRVTGWRIPVDELRYWVRGLEAPGSGERPRLDGQGRLQSVHQDGWTVRFLSYGTYDGLQLPEKIDMVHRSDDDSEPQLSLRLVMDEWKLNP
jgi:outer membrane lipoprotein LolB